MTEPAGYVPFPAFAEWVGEYDGSLVDSYAEVLASARDRWGAEQARHALEVASRYAAVDTGAIEGLYETTRGFTRTIAEQSANWEAALSAHPEAEHHIRDALAGYELVLDAVTRREAVTQVWIRELHRTLCASQETYTVYVEVLGTLTPESRPLPKGTYKTQANFPTNVQTGRVHFYAPATDTPAEMGRLVDELRSAAFETAHPVVQAAYAHYAFVCVHPFADGNGRVARALASAFLYRRPGIPLVIFADQAPSYLDALEAADGGRADAFIGFIEERAIDAVNLVVAEIEGGTTIDTAELAAALAGTSGRPAQTASLSIVAERLEHLLRDRLASLAAAVQLPVGVSCEVDADGQMPYRSGWSPRPLRSLEDSPTHTRLLLTTQSPRPRSVALETGVGVRDSESMFHDAEALARPSEFRVMADSLTRRAHLDVLIREIHPSVSEAFLHRLDAWLRARLREVVNDLAELVHQDGSY